MHKPVVLLTDPIEPASMARLAGCEVVLLPDQQPESYRPLMRRANILIVRSGQPLPGDFLDDAPSLLSVIRHGAGLDVLPIESANRRLVPVANVPGGNSQAVAEYGVSVMAMLNRRLHRIDHALRTRGWTEARGEIGDARNLQGRTVGVVGLGHVGRKLARMCHAGLEMRVLGHAPRANLAPNFVRLVDLDTLFRESDFVVLACALTPETRHLCSTHLLDQMKAAAFLINLARGELVDTEALVTALVERRIAGAALDVFEQEPLPSSHSLLLSDRVILTPHMAAITRESVSYNSDMSVTQAVELLAGDPPRHLANPSVWEPEKQRRERIRSTLSWVSPSSS